MNKPFKEIIGIAGIIGLVLVIVIAVFSQDRTTPYVPNTAPVTNSKLSVENESREDLVEDAELVAEVGEATFAFITDSVNTILEYINNDDYEGLIAYAYTNANSDEYIDTISNSFYEARNLAETDKAKDIIDDLKYVFTDYISVLENLGSGNVSDNLNTKIGRVIERINEIRADIENFYE